MTISHPDQKYIEALINGDNDLVDELYARLSGKIKWMVLQNNGGEQDAADILQEALVDMYRKARNGFMLTCPVDNFIYMVCRNKWISELRRRKKSIVTFKDDERYSTIGEDSFAQSELSAVIQQRRDLLRDKIAELGEGCRKLLELSSSGRNLMEVAALMNTTYAYIRKKKSDCIGKLTELVKKSPGYKLLLY